MSYGLKFVFTRAFNNTGPRIREPFVTSNFARQFTEIEKRLRETILNTGDLSAQRDLLDVRDIVNAYWLSVQRCEFGEVYNICSERSRSIQFVLNLLQDMVKIKAEVKQYPERMRPSDVEVLLGDCSKFKKRTGWAPVIPFEKTMRDLLDYWKVKIKIDQIKEFNKS